MTTHTFTEADVLGFARAAYDRGRACFEIDPSDCALLVIDMQEEFVRPGWTPFWIPDATRQVPRIRELADCCRRRQIPVIYTVFSNTHRFLDRPASGSLMANRFGEVEYDTSTLFTEGKIVGDLAPHPDDIVIHKPSYGAFYDTPLETILKNLRRNTVIITGTLTNLCCGLTARHAYERGFKVVFGSDVNATNDPALQQAELRTVRSAIGRVMSAEEILSCIDPARCTAGSFPQAESPRRPAFEKDVVA